MKFTVIGSASSFGTPATGNFWGACDPAEPRNRRSRASLVVESAATRILVDATPDLRQQLNDFNVSQLDAVLLTHGHSDHINGVDDLRALALNNGKPVPVYGDAETLEEVSRRWPYAFKVRNPEYYSAFCEAHVVDRYGHMQVGDIAIDRFEQDHVVMKSIGYRFGDVAYSVDMADMPEQSLDALAGIKTWIVDGSGYKREKVSTHATLERIYKWVERLKPEMTYVSVLTTHMDYKTLCDELPPHIRPAYDGLVVEG